MTDFTITITVENDEGSASGSMVLSLRPAAPTYQGTLENQEAREGVPFSYDTAPHFTGRDLTFSAVGLPVQFSIDAKTGAIKGAY